MPRRADGCPTCLHVSVSHLSLLFFERPWFPGWKFLSYWGLLGKTCCTASCLFESWTSLPSQAVLMSVETAKFMVMALLTVNLKQIFRHVDATLPKYLIRHALHHACHWPLSLHPWKKMQHGRAMMQLQPAASIAMFQ